MRDARDARSIDGRAITAPGGVRYVQCFYRNALASYCPPALSNRTNGLVLVYGP